MRLFILAVRLHFRKFVCFFVRYEGEYRRGVKEGTGTFIYPDGSKYEGEWKAGVRAGLGKYTYANGDWYEGSWNDSYKEGYGVYYHSETEAKYAGRLTFLLYVICEVCSNFAALCEKLESFGESKITQIKKYMCFQHVWYRESCSSSKFSVLSFL